jgi:hypothetical protein
MPRNSVGLRTALGPIQHFTKPEGNHSTGGFFNSPKQDKGVFLWVICGVNIRDTLFLFSMEVVNAPDRQGPFKFSFIGSTMIMVQNSTAPPMEWQPQYFQLPFTDPNLNFNTAVSITNGFMYVLGSRNTTEGVLMRVPLADMVPGSYCVSSGLAACAQFLVEENTWGAMQSQSNLQVMVPNVPSETTLTYNSVIRKWMFLEIPFAGNQVFLRSADMIWGPYSAPQPIYDIPKPFNESDKFFCYAVKVHEELGSEADFVWTFMSNSWNISDLDDALQIYVPKFISTKITIE